jgi:hypothetical protein
MLYKVLNSLKQIDSKQYTKGQLRNDMAKLQSP